MGLYYEYYMAFLEALNANQGILTVLFTLVLLLVITILAREIRRLRTLGTQPKLEVYLLPAHASPIIINMVIRNTGGGAARDIRWRINADTDDLDAHGVPLLKMSLFQVLHYLPAKETIQFFFGTAPRILSEPKLKPIEIRVAYRDGRRRKKDTFLIDLQPFQGMMTLGKPAEYEAASALREIQRDLHNIATGLSQPRIITQTREKYLKERERSSREAPERSKQTPGEGEKGDTEGQDS